MHDSLIDNFTETSYNENMNTKRKYCLIWAVVACASSILSITDHLGLFGGDGAPSTLFFTSWSTWLCTAVAYISLAKWHNEEYSFWFRFLKFSANIMAVATFIVSAFVLPEKIWMISYWTKLGGIFKHFLLPLLTIGFELFIDRKKKYNILFSFYGIAIPVIYWTAVIVRFVTARKKFGGEIPSGLWIRYYPYGFTNIDNGHTLKGLVILLCGIGVGLILFGLLFVLADKKSKEND